MSRSSGGEIYLRCLDRGVFPPFPGMIFLLLRMVIPGILAQVCSVAMQYIDASMVGHLGSSQAASVGLVSSSVWLICGMGLCLNVGHYVQISQLVGAGRLQEARNLTVQAWITSLTAGILIGLAAAAVSSRLPGFLGGEPAICQDAADYFLCCALSVPFLQINMLATGVLQGAGSMKLPGLLNILRCLLDVVFNFLLIFEGAAYSIGGWEIHVPGLGLGVMGAALGTAMAEMCVALLMTLSVSLLNPRLRRIRGEGFRWRRDQMIRALRLSFPVGLEHGLICLAMVVSVMIVATLGAVAVAAHSMAITAESFCYMIAWGIGTSASALMGQTVGAGRREMAVRLGWLVTGLGAAAVGCAAVLMYAAAPLMMALMTPDPAIQQQGAEMLRTVAWAEPLFAATIVISGALRGAGDTMVPSSVNCLCKWLVRIPLSFLLAWSLGLYGVWVAMSLELCITGICMLIRLRSGRWLKITAKEEQKHGTV